MKFNALFQSLELVESSGELRQRLRDNTRQFRQGLKAAGLTVAGDDHPICPVLVGDAALAVELATGMLGDTATLLFIICPLIMQLPGFVDTDLEIFLGSGQRFQIATL